MSILLTDKPAMHYHGDIDLPEGVEGPTLSASNIKEILTHSPAFAYAKLQQAAEGLTEPPKSIMSFGSAAHAVILGDNPGASLEIIDAPNFMGSDAKALRDQALAAGKYPILLKTTNTKNPLDMEILYNMKEVYAHSKIATYLKGIECFIEASIYWQDDELGIWKRARHDLLPSKECLLNGIGIIDYKTTGLDFHDWSRKYLTAMHGWTRLAHYVESVISAYGVIPNVWFIVQQTFAPYALRYYTLPLGFAYQQIHGEEHSGFEFPKVGDGVEVPDAGVLVERFEQAAEYCDIASGKWAKSIQSGIWEMPNQAGYFNLTDTSRMASLPATYPEIATDGETNGN